jgi:hypothetical protein
MNTNLSEIDLFEDVSNPLDSVEEVLCANDWIFDRTTPDDLSVQVTGRMGEYNLHFHWQEEYSAMRFWCVMDIDIKPEALDAAAKMMAFVNSGLWLGHFAFRDSTKEPSFTHTTLFRGLTQTSGAEHIQDLVDIALAECERYYPAFEMLSRGLPENSADVHLALMHVAGES